MILLCGIPSEPPLDMVATELTRLRAPFVVFNQRHVAAATMTLIQDDEGPAGTLHLGTEEVRLGDVRGVYTRLMNPAFLPELARVPADGPERFHAARVHDLLVRWCEVAPARVVNRIAAGGSNASKPYQAALIMEAGLRVPDTLVTNDPAAAEAFVERHGRVVYKSASGARSIVQELSHEDRARLADVAACPTLLQRLVVGTNVRVHVVGDAVFATRIESDAIDYRYAGRTTGVPATLTATQLDDDTAARCVALTRRLGLAFSGIDLMVTDDGETFCLEANPCPGFSYFESHTGQPIAQTLAAYLSDSLRS
ncbi:MAG TPA: ATP-grasp domain-containing protein [Longimicrobiales bacterium]